MSIERDDGGSVVEGSKKGIGSPILPLLLLMQPLLYMVAKDGGHAEGYAEGFSAFSRANTLTLEDAKGTEVSSAIEGIRNVLQAQADLTWGVDACQLQNFQMQGDDGESGCLPSDPSCSAETIACSRFSGVAECNASVFSDDYNLSFGAVCK